MMSDRPWIPPRAWPELAYPSGVELAAWVRCATDEGIPGVVHVLDGLLRGAQAGQRCDLANHAEYPDQIRTLERRIADLRAALDNAIYEHVPLERQG